MKIAPFLSHSLLIIFSPHNLSFPEVKLILDRKIGPNLRIMDQSVEYLSAIYHISTLYPALSIYHYCPHILKKKNLCNLDIPILLKNKL